MHIDIHSANVATSPALDAYARRRLQRAIGPALDRIGTVIVRLSRLGDRGDDRLACGAEIALHGGSTIQLTAHARGAYAAIDHLARRLKRVVRERVTLRRETARRAHRRGRDRS